MIPADQVVQAPSEHGRVFDTLRAALDSFVEYFGEREVELPANPDGEPIAFVSNGEMTYDQGLFAARFTRFRMGPPGAPATTQIQGDSQYSIEAEFHLIRKVETPNVGGFPNVGEREADAQILLRDVDVLVEAAQVLTAKAMQGGPAYVAAPYRRLMLQEVIPYGPTAGVGGCVATYVIEPR